MSRPWRVSVDGLRTRCYTHEDGARACAERLAASTGRIAMVWHIERGPLGAWGYEPMNFDPSEAAPSGAVAVALNGEGASANVSAGAASGGR